MAKNVVLLLAIYIAQQMLEKLLDSGLISREEFNKITQKNRQTFSPKLAELMP